MLFRSKLMKAVLRDKKAADGVLRVVLPVAVGNCVVRTMTVEELAAAVDISCQVWYSIKAVCDAALRLPKNFTKSSKKP